MHWVKRCTVILKQYSYCTMIRKAKFRERNHNDFYLRGWLPEWEVCQWKHLVVSNGRSSPLWMLIPAADRSAELSSQLLLRALQSLWQATPQLTEPPLLMVYFLQAFWSSKQLILNEWNNLMSCNSFTVYKLVLIKVQLRGMCIIIYC